LALPQADVVRLVDGTDVPTHSSAVELLRLLFSEEKRQLERLCETDEVELGRC
jgi:hypothetical protein